MNSRRIFNTVSKEQVAMICTFQLALHTTNQRWLDATCLSNSKQIKEVVAQAVFASSLSRGFAQEEISYVRALRKQETRQVAQARNKTSCASKK